MRFFLALLSTVLKASLALRGAFLLQAGLMVVNNVLFFSTWWILFQRFENIRGYHLPDMLALVGVSSSESGSHSSWRTDTFFTRSALLNDAIAASTSRSTSARTSA